MQGLHHRPVSYSLGLQWRTHHALAKDQGSAIATVSSSFSLRGKSQEIAGHQKRGIRSCTEEEIIRAFELRGKGETKNSVYERIKKRNVRKNGK